jgi:hypothetical protein
MKTVAYCGVLLGFSVVTLIACSNPEDKWVPIGQVTLAVVKAEAMGKVEFRTQNYRGGIKRTIDMLDLTLKMQSEGLIGRKVLIAIDKCFAPQVRKGMASVQCYAGDGESIIVTGSDDIRSQLLRLEETGNHGYAVAEIMPLFARQLPCFRII